MSALAHVTDDDQVITGEVQTINISGAITLAHPPDPDDAVTIPGYTQVNTPIVNTLEFFVNYANSVISFNASQSGVSVSVSYTSLGEEVNAALLNPLIDAINAASSPALIYRNDSIGGVTGTGAAASFSINASFPLAALLFVRFYDSTAAAYISSVPGIAVGSFELGTLGALYSSEAVMHATGSAQIDIVTHSGVFPSGHAIAVHLGYLSPQ